MFLHKTKWSFGTKVWHKVTGHPGEIFGIMLFENTAPRYLVVFCDSRKTDECIEAELVDEQPVITT